MRLDGWQPAGAGAYRDAWSRIANVVQKVSGKLLAYNPEGETRKEKNIFRDTLTGNVADLVDKMLIAAADPDLRLRIGQRARKRVRSHCVDAIASRYLAALRATYAESSV